MPRKPRKKDQQQHKRIQVLDDEGWTHITSTTNKPNSRSHHPIRAVEDQLSPAEIPDGLTLQKLKDRYEWHKDRWQSSTAWDAVKRVLEVELKKPTSKLDNCVCIGLGSPSGLLRGGLVDRRSISMFQLAALASMLEFISQPEIPVTIGKCYAQDPVFNLLDKELLNLIDIEVVQNPEASSLLNEHTFLYAPGAERIHLMQLLPKSPALFFGGPLDNGPHVNLTTSDEDILDKFASTRCSVNLPEFEPNTNAFWKTGLYWRADKAYLCQCGDEAKRWTTRSGVVSRHRFDATAMQEGVRLGYRGESPYNGTIVKALLAGNI